MTASGLRYIDLVTGEGDLLTRGTTVAVHYAGYLLNGKLFDTSIDSIARKNSYNPGRQLKPFGVTVGAGQVIQGWDEGLSTNMRYGGKRRLIVPAELAYGTRGFPPTIPPNSTLVFDIEVLPLKVVDSRTGGSGTASGAGGIDTMSTINGLHYIDLEKGTGKRIAPGMKLWIDYAGYLANGELFDTSIESIGKEHNFDRGGYPFKPLNLVIGRGQVIRGWDEGLTTEMNIGGRRRLIVPASLGYGPQGAPPNIPPNATLIFDVHVLRGE